MKDVLVILLSDCGFRENQFSERHVLPKGAKEIFNLFSTINVDFGENGISTLHIILLAVMSFRENGRRKAHVLTGVNEITFTRVP